MCVKNVNATILFCSEIQQNDDNVNSLIGVYDSVVPIRENNSYYLDNFNMVLNCCIMFDETFENRTDCIQLDTEYEFMVWMAHVESGLGIPLYKSDLLIERQNLRTWCKNFYEFKRFLKFEKLEIPKGLGNYAIKLFIRKKEENETPWNNQIIHSLIIGESR